MKSDVVLNLDRPDGTYSAGDVVKGSVVITLTQEIKAKGIEVYFHGYGRVSWDEHRTYTKMAAQVVSMKNTEQFLNHTIVLLKKERERANSTTEFRTSRANSRANSCAPFLPTITTESEELFTLTAREHTFPFEFTLPQGLPSSYEGKWGGIRYLVKATLRRPWRDVEREMDLNINAVVDLNDEPEHVRPIGALGEFHNGIMCCPGYGAVSLELRIRRRGYVAGEGIPFFVEIDNQSNRKLHDAKVALVQVVTFKAGDKTKKTTQVITSLNRGEVQPQMSYTWEGDSLLIPPNIPMSSHKNNKTIQIKYRVSLIINHSAWSDEYNLPVTIVMGSVPLRKSTISSYLKILGYASGDTPPGGSPTTSTARLSNPKLPLLPAGRGRQSVPAIHWSLDPLSGRRRCSAAVVLERPRGPMFTSASRQDSETSSTHSLKASPVSERKLDVRRKSKSRALSQASIIEEEANGEQQQQQQQQKRQQQTPDGSSISASRRSSRESRGSKGEVIKDLRRSSKPDETGSDQSLVKDQQRNGSQRGSKNRLEVPVVT